MPGIVTAMDERVDRIAELLTETGRAHHQAFIATDGEDPEWPIWYAGYLHEPLAEILGAGLTKSELVYHMLAAEAEAGDDPWNERYAKRFVAAAS